MVKTIISVDLSKSPSDQNGVIHNRWHPEIPCVANVKPGEIFRVECLDWTGGQIKNSDTADEIKIVDLSRCHHLSGPIGVEGAEPGDYLEVEILDIHPLPGHEWGYTAIFDVNNGGGFMHEQFKNPSKIIWDFEGIYATSRHLPRVKFPGIMHPGIIGTAPSHELLKKWNEREGKLVAENEGKVPAYAHLPNPTGSMLGRLDKSPEIAREKAKEAARTIPPRENGGNCDIKNLSKGSKVWLPVFVPGASLSLGDIHFSQGDGEVSFCGAIEMAAGVTMRTRIIKNGMKLHGNLNMPIFMPGPVEPRYSRYLTFEGISVDESGKQLHLDASVSFKQAVLNCIEYFKRFGYTGEQICMLLSTCPCEGQINSIVAVPNACCSISIPTEIFDFDVMPKEGGHSVLITTKAPMTTPIKM